MPTIALVESIPGASASTIGLKQQRGNDMLGSFWTLPAHPVRVWLGRMITEAVTACYYGVFRRDWVRSDHDALPRVRRPFSTTVDVS